MRLTEHLSTPLAKGSSAACAVEDSLFNLALRDVKTSAALVHAAAKMLELQLGQESAFEDLREMVTEIRRQAELTTALIDDALTGDAP